MSARPLLGLSVLVVLVAGCAGPADDDVDEDGAQAITTGSRATPGPLPDDAPAGLDPDLFGDWTVARGAPALPRGYPEKVRVALEREPEGPGYRMGIFRADAPRVPALDHPAFVRAGLPEKCESVDMDRSTLRICHLTRVERQRVVHTVHLREWFGWVPGRSEVTTQTLTRDGDTLRYTFHTRGREESSYEVAFTR